VSTNHVSPIDTLITIKLYFL